MKQNVSEKVIGVMKLAFSKKCKNMSIKQEIVSDAPPSRHGHFHMTLIIYL